MSKLDDIGGVAAAALDASEGVMQVLEVLVIALAANGALDTTEFARLLATWRHTRTADGSLQALFIERMLALVVEDPRAFLRRALLQVVGDSPRDAIAQSIDTPLC